MSGTTLEKSPASTCVEVGHSAGLAEIEADWRRLAARSRAATVFQTYDWNAAWWRTLGKGLGRALRIVTFRDPDGELIGLAPLMISPWYGLPVSRLSFLGMGAADYLDVLCAPGCEEQVCSESYRYLASSSDWQVADLQQLREGAVLRMYPPQVSDLVAVTSSQEACPYLPLPADWDKLTASLGKKTRANIGYYDRALRKVYDLDMGYVVDEDDLDSELTRLFALHKRRWNRRWLPGVFGTKRVQRFHREAARALLAQGVLRLFRLRLDGATQASLYCFSYGGRLCYYQAGFEPSLAKYSPGTVLTAHAIHTAIDEGCDTFDLLRGDEPYKSKWTQSSRVNMRRMITKRSQPHVLRLASAIVKVENAVETRIKTWARGKK